MEKAVTLKQLRATAKKLARTNERRDALVAERDELIRTAKAEGAQWEELQDAVGMKTPTVIARALKKSGTSKPPVM